MKSPYLYRPENEKSKSNMTELPAEFTAYTRRLLGDEAYEKLVCSLADETPVSVRYNRAKWSSASVPEGAIPVPWATDAFYLSGRLPFTFDPLFHAGCYYVQEASSMFVGHALAHLVPGPCVALDLCAAPGGKSTLARSILPVGSLLISNEIVRPRAQILAENMAKWGHPATIVTQNAPADFALLRHFFDVVLADVPCSGEGMFRKDAGAIDEWSAEGVDLCQQRQRGIVADIWESLKPGGLLLYSTCTYNALENEENVGWMIRTLGAEPLPLPIDEAWGIANSVLADNLPVYRFFPSRIRGEGFFLAVLRKPIGDAQPSEQAFATTALSPRTGKVKQRKSQRPIGKQKPLPSWEECRSWVKNSETYAWEVVDDVLTAFPKTWADRLALLKQYLHLLHAGIPVAELKGRDWVPTHALAMSTTLQHGFFPETEISYSDAVAYLRRETVVLTSSLPLGPVLLTYRGIPLGFVKNIGNRANNLYPAEWRIRSTYIPSAEEERVCM